MAVNKRQRPRTHPDLRRRDPLMDRRSGEDRRQVYFLPYFEQGNPDRRSDLERRQNVERRTNFVRVSEWSSVGLDQEAEH
ncbi:hypothetical protein [Desulfogranum mediterraneum]|uniref:hypothetical protein n=1 Tax=Desulfogranum mediterraneum TaxID=160661 RepID=UPI001378F3D5|nr:hypothetical protein [Desulfogranum mediterraneum]